MYILSGRGDRPVGENRLAFPAVLALRTSHVRIDETLKRGGLPMSLMKTLAKVAIGVAVAKGVGAVMQKRGSASAANQAGRAESYGGAHSPQTDEFSGRMGELLGKGRSTPDQAGPSGGLGDLLDQLGGGASAQRGKAPSGASLDDMLGGLKGGGGGGIGDLLGGLLGGAASQGGGSFGELLNQSLGGGGSEPEVAPSQEQEAGAALMLRAMVQAAMSDGKLDDAEREKLIASLSDASPQEKELVNRMLNEQVDARGMAAMVPSGMEQQIYMMSIMGINLDSREEAQYLHDFATAMGIGPQDVNSVHDSLGVPRIYS